MQALQASDVVVPILLLAAFLWGYTVGMKKVIEVLVQAVTLFAFSVAAGFGFAAGFAVFLKI